MTGPATNLAKMQSHFIKQVSDAPQARAHKGRLSHTRAMLLILKLCFSL
jgi:hypothetical protein